MAFGRAKRQKKPFVVPKLQITSMMDMFTIILIFLLFSYSNNPETLDVDKKIFLPKSSASMDYKDSIRLVLNKDELKLDGNVIAKLEDGKIIGLEMLYDKLKNYRKVADDLKKAETAEEKKQHILFMCDKTHSFKTINSVVKTAGRAGYPNFQFAVIENK